MWELDQSISGLAPSPLVQDVLCAAMCTTGALLWVNIWSALAGSGRVTPKLSRKMIHVGSAPIFLAVWPLFSAEPTARLFAAVVPFLNLLKLVAASQREGDSLVTAISRSGERKEALGGPFFYVLVLFVATIACWRRSIPGLLAVCQMAVGDGVADIVGRRFGSTNHWSFAPSKSIAGSLAFIAGGLVSSLAMIWWLGSFGFLSLRLEDAVLKVAIVSVACAAVELLPADVVDDNISVPLSAAVLGSLLFGW